jgi:two-component system response regulator HydG
MANDQEVMNYRPGGDADPVQGNGCGDGASGAGRIIAASKAMREILEVVRRSAPTDAPVLIYGEPDTGKKLIACEIHRRSRRAAGPFVQLVCGALRESDLAEKLFGRGGHGTGPDNPTPAILAEAGGGTLFLEEVSQLPLWGQVRLLEILQQGRHSCGATHAGVGFDVRVIASSTADLSTAMAQRVLLSSLYYYLKVVEIRVPPLRHRSQDICPLAENYLAIANAARASQGGRPPCRFAKEALQHLVDYDWPGNTLQLASIVAHAVLLTDGDEITPIQVLQLLGEVVPRDDSETISVPLIGGLKEIERTVVAAVIERCRGNKAEAARVLGLHRREVYRILQRKAGDKEDPLSLPLTLVPSVVDCEANTYS